ncbi:hypothetical protein MASR1M36_01340 [Candidatus Cloacimonadaceae bacterium]
MLFERHRARLRRWGRQFRGRQKTCPCAIDQCFSLDQLPQGSSAIIICNRNLKTIERGLYVGSRLSMFRNDSGEPNIIVAAGDARYVLDRRIAREIRVKVME